MKEHLHSNFFHQRKEEYTVSVCVCACVYVFVSAVIYLIVSKWGAGSVAGLSPDPLNFRRGSRTKAIREDKDKSSLDEVF